MNHTLSSSKSSRVQSRKPSPALGNSQHLSEPVFIYKIKGLEQNSSEFFPTQTFYNFTWNWKLTDTCIRIIKYICEPGVRIKYVSETEPEILDEFHPN